jgi:hypothetical protein
VAAHKVGRAQQQGQQIQPTMNPDEWANEEDEGEEKFEMELIGRI